MHRVPSLLTRARHKKGYSTEAVSFAVGKTHSWFKLVESGKFRLKPQYFKALIQFLDLDEDELIEAYVEDHRDEAQRILQIGS